LEKLSRQFACDVLRARFAMCAPAGAPVAGITDAPPASADQNAAALIDSRGVTVEPGGKRFTTKWRGRRGSNPRPPT
jgi:hypothetical protein